MAQPRPSEYEVKAAFLYNFAKFVDWPDHAFAEPDTPIVIGLAGSDPFDGYLERLVEGKQVNGRSIIVRVVSRPDLISSCHLFFFSADQDRRFAEFEPYLSGRAILTVGEGEGFTRRGGMIRFYMDQDRVRFEINSQRALQKDLRLSSKLLSVARIVSYE